MIKLAAISDTHGKHTQVQVPPCHLLVHAGDFTCSGHINEVKSFAKWLDSQPATHKVAIAGNHDSACWTMNRQVRDIFAFYDVHYLEDASVTLDGYKIHGSPWTPTFGDWAFMADEEGLARRFQAISPDTDILVTHGPAWGYGDLTARGVGAGSMALLERIEHVQPALHLFGHIHEAYSPGTWVVWPERNTLFVNASSCNLEYRITHPPVVLELPDRPRLAA